MFIIFLLSTELPKLKPWFYKIKQTEIRIVRFNDTEIEKFNHPMNIVLLEDVDIKNKGV